MIILPSSSRLWRGERNSSWVLAMSAARRLREFANANLMARLMNVAHWVFTFMFNVVYGTRLRDPFTMYKVMAAEVVVDIEFTANRFDFDWELVGKLARLGHKPIEVPVWYRSRDYTGGKKVRVFRDPLTWMVALFKYRFVKIRHRGATELVAQEGEVANRAAG